MAPFLFAPFQPVVSSTGNRITYCENFGEENLLGSGENNHFEPKRIALNKEKFRMLW